MVELVVTVGTVAGAGVGALLLAVTACGRWAARAGREEDGDLVAPAGAGYGYATARLRERTVAPVAPVAPVADPAPVPVPARCARRPLVPAGPSAGRHAA